MTLVPLVFLARDILLTSQVFLYVGLAKVVLLFFVKNHESISFYLLCFIAREECMRSFSKGCRKYAS